MINREQARQIASDWIAMYPAIGLDGSLELCILDDRTRELDFGWVFFYTSKLFHETGDFRYALAGNAPLLVDRRDGALRPTGTAQPIEHYIERYRRERPMERGRDEDLVPRPVQMSLLLATKSSTRAVK